VGKDCSNSDQAHQATEGENPDMPQTAASVVTVNVLHTLRPGFFHQTAIDKRPVDGPVWVDEHGCTGDRQIGSSHGGPDKAVYAYSTEDADWWSEQLAREISPGLFGENLRTRGLDVTSALIGQRWQIGDVVLEVRLPRSPCENLSLRMGIKGFHLRFAATGRVGALCKVVQSGSIQAGDTIDELARPDHSVTVGDWARGPDAEQLQALLQSGIPLAKSLRAKARRIVQRAERSADIG
jgi:MOSC domain-containing protein YiiM